MYRANREYRFKRIPGILFNLLMAQRKLPVVIIDIENNYIELIADPGEFIRMVDALKPGQIADMHHSSDPFGKLNKYTVGCDILNDAFGFGTNREFLSDPDPGIFRQP